MGTKYIENLSPHTKFVGGLMIPPGEGRTIDTARLPPELRDEVPAPAAPARPSLAQAIEELLKGNVASVKAALHGLTGEGLDLVETIESGSATPRKTVLEAVAAERVRVAQAKLDADEAQAEFDAAVEAAYQAQLSKLTPDELAAIGAEGEARLRDQALLDVKAALEQAGSAPKA